MRLLRIAEVSRRTGRSRSGIYDDLAAGCFPRPVKISERCIAFREDEVEEWIEKRIQARDAA